MAQYEFLNSTCKRMTESDPKTGRILHQVKRLFYRLFKKGDSKEEFIEQIHEAEEQSVLNADAVSMMEGVLQISDLAVRDVMVPRGRMDCIEIEDDLHKTIDFVTKIAHSRFPVTEGKKDNIIGILLAKDLLAKIGVRDKREDGDEFHQSDWYQTECQCHGCVSKSNSNE